MSSTEHEYAQKHGKSAGRRTFLGLVWGFLALIVPWATIVFGAWLNEFSVTFILFIVAAAVPFSGLGYLFATFQSLPVDVPRLYRFRIAAGVTCCIASLCYYAWIFIPTITRLFN